MAGISPNLNKLLRKTLQECGPFASDQELRNVFADSRINIWANLIPQAGSPTARMDNLIAFLYGKYNYNKHNALVLFVEVLIDRTDIQDRSHQQLKELLFVLETELKKHDNIDRLNTTSFEESRFQQENPTSSTINFSNKTAIHIYEFLRDRFNLEELKILCFYLNVDSDDLSEGTRLSKALELVKFYQRRNQLSFLIQTIERIRPDFSLSSSFRE